MTAPRSSSIRLLAPALDDLGVAMAELHDAWTEFGRMRHIAESARHTRQVREDPTYVPYVFESAEERAERRRKLHAPRSPAGDQP